MLHLVHYLVTRIRRSIAGIGVAIGLIADVGDIEAIGEELL